MKRITVYRVGNEYILDWDSEDGEPITLVCELGVAGRKSQLGPALLYRRGKGYGVSVETAIAEGWCRIQ